MSRISSLTIGFFLSALAMPLCASTDEKKEGRNTAEEDAKLPAYTWNQIQTRGTGAKVWVVLYGRVYDVTNLRGCPGKNPTIWQRIAGKDMTDEFEQMKLHTTQATRKKIKKYLIGKVQDAQLGDLFAEIDNGGGFSWPSGPTIGFIVVAILACCGIVYSLFQNENILIDDTSPLYAFQSQKSAGKNHPQQGASQKALGKKVPLTKEPSHTKTYKASP